MLINISKCVRKGGPPEVPDGSVEDSSVILEELRTFLGLNACNKKVLFCKSRCQTSGSVSGTWGPPEVPDGSVEDRRVILVELRTFISLIGYNGKVLFCKSWCHTSGSVSGKGGSS